MNMCGVGIPLIGLLIAAVCVAVCFYQAFR